MTLGVFITTILSGITIGLVMQYLAPEVKIVWWHPHQYLYRIPSTKDDHKEGNPNVTNTFSLYVHSITIQNIGRKLAEDIEIVHRDKPDLFQLNPPLDYEEHFTPNGEHVIKIKRLATKEFFTIQFLSYQTWPELHYIRSPQGLAKTVPVQIFRLYSKWVYAITWLFIIVGIGYSLYWIIRFAIALWTSIQPI